MKKITLLLAAMMICSLSFSQLAITGQTEQGPLKFKPSTIKNYTDTLFEYYDRGTAFYTYTVGSYGYVSVSNSFSSETGQHFTFSGNAQVIEVLAWFGSKEIIGAPDTRTINLYNADAGYLPTGGALGSTTYSSSDVDTSGYFTSILFGSPVSISNSFVLGFAGNAVSVDDTLVLVFNSSAAGNGNAEGRYVANFVAPFGSGWAKFNTVLTTFDADPMIFPVLNVITGVNSASNNNLTLNGCFPNPATTNAAIGFSLKNETEVSIQVFDLTGRNSFEFKKVLAAGSHNVDVDVTNMPAGNYYYNISTQEGHMTSKFQVVK
ncbi:MAG: T9SS type A sorting domain-containing protein [Bacteroidota bacterium]